jgi:hypothetical protein
MISPRRELDKRLTSGAGYMVGFTGITEGKTMNKLPCPLHADCELYLREEDCGYRNGQITYETPFFCGPGSTTSKCTAPDVIVQNVTPSDPAVITAYNQQVAAQYAAQAGTARLAAAKEIYGSDANYFLGVQDTINACHAAGTTCNIYVGNPPAAP